MISAAYRTALVSLEMSKCGFRMAVGQSPGGATSKREAKTQSTLDRKMQRDSLTIGQTANTWAWPVCELPQRGHDLLFKRLPTPRQRRKDSHASGGPRSSTACYTSPSKTSTSNETTRTLSQHPEIETWAKSEGARGELVFAQLRSY